MVRQSFENHSMIRFIIITIITITILIIIIYLLPVGSSRWVSGRWRTQWTETTWPLEQWHRNWKYHQNRIPRSSSPLSSQKNVLDWKTLAAKEMNRGMHMTLKRPCWIPKGRMADMLMSETWGAIQKDLFARLKNMAVEEWMSSK